ncbi:hypothetical protein CW304_26730 [Bacillus sp. UFRGS-B20]|nr:hypothetical protein CW304_26730 [Bacillus sp. UFRGS-B20]
MPHFLLYFFFDNCFQIYTTGHSPFYCHDFPKNRYIVIAGIHYRMISIGIVSRNLFHFVLLSFNLNKRANSDSGYYNKVSLHFF